MTAPRVAIVVGGTIDAARRAAADSGEKPRIDVLELARRTDAELFDFGALAGAGALVALVQKRLGWSAALALLVARKSARFDAIYATGEDIGLPLALLLRLRGRGRPALVLRLEQPIYGGSARRRALFARYARTALAGVALTLCRTRAHVAVLEKHLGVAPDRMRFFPETTDTVFFAPGRPGDCGGELPDLCGDERPLLVSAGLEMRDYPALIEAVRGLSVRLVIGAGSPWSKFRFGAEAMPDLPENVQVSAFSPRQMRALYREAALVVLSIAPTDRACGMNVVLEAWSLGTPVLAARTVGLGDYIEDDSTGVFFTPGDASDLREKIVSLLADPQRLARLAAAGSAHARSALCMERYLEVVEEALRNAAARHS